MAVTNQQIVEFLLANPGMSDAEIVAAMETYKISPAQMAETVGLPVAAIQEKFDAALPFVNPQIEERVVDMGEGTRSEYYIKGTDIQADAPTFTETSPTTGLTESSAPELKANNITIYDPQAKGEYVYTPDGKLIGFNPGERDSGFGGFLNEVYQDNKGVIIPALTFGALSSAGLLSGAAGGAATVGATEAATAFELANAGIAGGTAAFTPAQLALIEAGATAAEVAAAGTGTAGLLTSATPTAAATAPTGATLKAGASSLLPTNALTGTTLGTAAAGAGGASLLTPAATATAGGLLTTAATKAAESVIGKAVGAGLTTAAGIEQARVSKEAAQAAQKKIDEETAAAKTAAQFRPVGMTTRFGSSQFAFDPKTGQLTSAGYTLSPEAKAAQDRFVKLAESGIQQAEGAQEAFKPLQTGAQSLFTLGNKYLAQSPEQVASDYLKSQMALLQPGRELELANLQNKLQQQGRAGLSVAQGGTLGATTPELQALFNARAQQEAILAANAQREGQQNVLFGAGLLGTGASTMGQYYGGQQAAYSPYTTAMNQVQALESAGQQPLTTGINLGNLVSTAGARAGELGLRGAGQSVALATGAAATNSPLATALTGLGSSGLLTTGINTAIDAFSSNQLDPSRPLGQRLEQPASGGFLPGSGLVNDLSMSEVGPARVAAPTGPMDVNTADMARRLGINLPASYTGTTTTVNPLLPNQQYTF